MKNIDEATFKVIYARMDQAINSAMVDPVLADMSLEQFFHDILVIIVYKSRARGLDMTSVLRELLLNCARPESVKLMCVGRAKVIAATMINHVPR